LLALVGCSGEPLVDADAEVLTSTDDDGAAVGLPTHRDDLPTAPAFAPLPEHAPQHTAIAFGPDSGPPYPIVLVHGWSGFTDLGPLEYFFGVKDRYAELGAEIFAPAQPPYASTEVRSEVLRAHVDAILESTGKRQVHLICHSQGGLDCRRLVAEPGYAQKVSSLITIGTPHHGTPVADLAREAPDGFVNPAGKLLGWLLGVGEGDAPEDEAWSDAPGVEEADYEAEMHDAIFDLSTEGAEAFNAAFPFGGEVRAFSVASVSNLKLAGEECDGGLLFESPWRVDAVDAALVASGLFISGLSLRDNDGLVPTDSMVWERFLGCLPADHLDQIGQIADFTPGLFSGFHHFELYDTLYTLVRTLEEEPDPDLALARMLDDSEDE